MAKNDIHITAEKLRELSRSLDGKAITRAVRNTLAAGARKLQKAASESLTRDKGPDIGRKLGKTIRSGATKDGKYGWVRVSNRGKRFMYENSRGKELPVAFWMNNGTKRMRGLGFIGKAERSAMSGIENVYVDAFEKQVVKQAKKSGLI